MCASPPIDLCYADGCLGEGISDHFKVFILPDNLKCAGEVYVIDPPDLKQLEIVECFKVGHLRKLPVHKGLVDRIRNLGSIRQIQFNGLVPVMPGILIVICNHAPDIYFVRISEQRTK